MDGNTPPVDPEGIVESSIPKIQLPMESVQPRQEVPSSTDEVLGELLDTTSSRVDDVNPTISRPSDPLHVTQPQRLRRPSGMLMGPNDPFFQEMQTQSRYNEAGHARYDLIGPFGREPDPDIDLPPGIPSLPKRGGGFPAPGPGRFGGGFGGFFP
ncbi:uncharacterized protein BXIN_1213 [Babesia sp. Xinjiang]|uniref:uncharacterized protein n=1 Tax=Babesia sp. Xinjiang TaxID=462227 RepID=UPI000A24DFC4|nr:uncharacterized protein BXIN_1213 [Babesia sp. Xinjiang]ORM40085.1 hypothetical protein BXIN_1213 [Babesia sp. Xinjiang]